MLEIKKLTAGNILKDINLNVAAGARYLLRGLNGSGKTTLVQVIMGNPDYIIKSGKIIFEKKEITKMPTAVRARMGIFLGSQNVPEIPGLSVMTFLKHSFQAHYGNSPMGEIIKKLKQAQSALDIPDSWLARSMNVGFSGGEKKRLMFLQLILLEPKFAILDEPDSGADKETQKKFAEIINKMKSTTFLIISHQEVFFKPTNETALQGGEIVSE